MGIALLFMLSQYFDLMTQAVDYSKYSGSSIRGFRHLMLRILHQIHLFVNSRLGSTQLSPHTSNCILEPSLQDVHPSSLVAIGLPANSLCIQPIPWLSNEEADVFTRGGQLRPTGFSTSPIVVLKGGKPHTSTSERSADRLDNLSCVRISEQEYTFQVTYVHGGDDVFSK